MSKQQNESIESLDQSQTQRLGADIVVGDIIQGDTGPAALVIEVHQAGWMLLTKDGARRIFTFDPWWHYFYHGNIFENWPEPIPDAFVDAMLGKVD